MLGIVRFDERDGLRKNSNIPRENPRNEIVDGQFTLLGPREIRVYDGLVFNPFRNVQRRIVMRIGILLFVVVYFGEIHNGIRKLARVPLLCGRNDFVGQMK